MFQRIRNQLVDAGYGDVIYRLEQSSEILTRVTKETLDEEISRFHSAAGVLPVVDGVDYAAAVLESASDNTRGDRRLFLLRHAMYRARWAAEGFDRGTSESEHFQVIMRKYRSCGG